MLRRLWGLLALVAGIDVQVVDMYRAMRKPTGGREGRKLESNNLADIQGVLRYVHQEVIVEHAQSQPDRTERKYGIDSIARYRVSVRNPERVAAASPVVGFSPFFSAFDFGVCTNEPALKELTQAGDFVGIQTHSQNAGPMIAAYPYYWFSLPGPCPNLPWQCIKGSAHEACTTTTDVVPQPCTKFGCASKKDEAAQTCEANFTDEKSMASCCLRYSGPGLPEAVIKGGLCEKSSAPTGETGCVYTYPDLEDKDFVNMDALSGITAMKCGKGDTTCKDWVDWRTNCYDPEKRYKKKFTLTWLPDQKMKVDVEEVDYCVEYDMHPYCQDSAEGCANMDCVKLKPEEKEIGLDFWKGRCEEAANTKRAEEIARQTFGKEDLKNHVMVDKELLSSNFKCAGHGGCTPNMNGGPYCTRQFGGVCTACYIPGTKEPFHNTDAFPTCPFDILKEGGYKPPDGTECKSNDAADVCCLYGITPCSKTYTDGSQADLSLEGFLGVMAASVQDPDQMFKFASHWVEANGGTVEDQEELKSEVYWLWRIHPNKRYEEAWEAFQEKLKASDFTKFGGSTSETASTSQGATTSEAGTTAGEVVSTAPETVPSTSAEIEPVTPHKQHEAFIPVWLIVIAVGGAIFLVAAWLFLSQRPAARGSAVEEDHRSLQMTRL